MAARTTPKKGFKRKTEKKYTFVEFELDFIDGTFRLPKFSQVPLGVQRKAMKNDPSSMFDFFEKHGSEGTVEILDDFDEEEYIAFMEAWSNASDVDLGK